MCLIDAEDYSDLPIRQYEEDNVLRELNKAYVGFRQTQQQIGSELQHRLPPVGASRDSSPSNRPPVAVQNAVPTAEPTLLYGGGRNAPLTLTKATIIKQLTEGRPPSLVRVGSQYASCDSQGSGGSCTSHEDEFRSANTSIDLASSQDTQSLLQSTTEGKRR